MKAMAIVGKALTFYYKIMLEILIQTIVINFLRAAIFVKSIFAGCVSI